MHVERLYLLYAADLAADNTRLWERIVLEALCRAVKKAAGTPCRRGLTDQPVTFDELYACIPLSPGTPTHPDYTKVMKPGEVLAWLTELTEAGWVVVWTTDFRVIRLTDGLFEAISRAWYSQRCGDHSYTFTRPGAKPGTQIEDQIYCASYEQAERINAIRAQREQALHLTLA